MAQPPKSPKVPSPSKETKAGKASPPPADEASTPSARAPRAARVREVPDETANRTDHAPPPIVIKGGSLIIELGVDAGPTPSDDLQDVGHSGPAPARRPKRFRWRKSTENKIAHVKVVDDAANTLYRNAMAGGVTVAIWLHDPDDDNPAADPLDLADIVAHSNAAGNRFHIETGDLHPRENSHNRRRRHRYRHRGDGLGADFEIEKVFIFRPDPLAPARREVLYTGFPEPSEDGSETKGMEVMFWTH